MNKNIFYSILGFLDARPMYGYELQQLSEKTIFHFYKYNISQIYPALKQMLELGYVAKSKDLIGSKARFIYSITESGKAHLLEWLHTPYDTEECRIPFLLKLFSCGEEAPAKHKQYTQYLHECEQTTKKLKALRLDLQNQTDIKPEHLACWLETLDFGLTMMQAKMQWIRSTIAKAEQEH